MAIGDTNIFSLLPWNATFTQQIMNFQQQHVRSIW